MKSRFLIIALLVALVACLSVGSAFAADLEQSDVSDVIVDDVSVSIDDDINTVSASEGTFSELQDLINSNTNGSITLDKDYSYDNGFDTEGILINKDISINGNGFTLNGKDKSRIFYVNNSDVIFQNIQFINGYVADGYGGAIYGYSEDETYGDYDVSILNCTFLDNYAESGAGAVDLDYGNIVISDCTFENNEGKWGGAIYGYYGDLDIFSSTFTNNLAEGGGALYIDNESSIVNCSFTNNYASDYAGAIYIGSNSTIINSNFTDNAAYEEGGAIYVSSSNFNLDNCIFTNNYVESSDSEGGAIWMGQSNFTANNCSFINNSAYDGGAIFDEWQNSKNIVKFISCNFINNTAENEGGAILFEYTNGNTTIESTAAYNSYFMGNSAKYGGAVYVYTECAFSTHNSTFVENNAVSGGAIYYYDSYGVCNVDFSNFINNSADEYGGAIYVGKYSDIDNITHCIFDGNNAPIGIDVVVQDGFSTNIIEDYWSMNFTTAEEFINAKLIYSSYSYWDPVSKQTIVNGSYVAPENWVLMSIYGPTEFKVRYNASFVAKFDKLTNGKRISDFTGVLPDYYTNVYAFDSAATAAYNYKWNEENFDVSEYIYPIVLKDNVASFGYVAQYEDSYYFRTGSPLTIWEEAVIEPVATAVNPVADLSVTKTADKAKYYVGDNVTYTIVVTNNGPDTAFDAIAKDILPAGMKFSYAIASKGYYDQITGVWNIGDLANGESVTLTIYMVAQKTGTIVNIVSVSSHFKDAKPDNNNASVSVEVVKKVNPNPNPDPNPNPTPNPTQGTGATLPAAGNPLALVVLSLLTLCVGGLKRKL